MCEARRPQLVEMKDARVAVRSGCKERTRRDAPVALELPCYGRYKLTAATGCSGYCPCMSYNMGSRELYGHLLEMRREPIPIPRMVYPNTN